jgi:hypothetical protein
MPIPVRPGEIPRVGFVLGEETHTIGIQSEQCLRCEQHFCCSKKPDVDFLMYKNREDTKPL